MAVALQVDSLRRLLVVVVAAVATLVVVAVFAMAVNFVKHHSNVVLYG